MSSFRLLREIFNVREASDPRDVERELNRAQSLRGGPTTGTNVRKWQDRARHHTPSTARMQADVDSASSVVKKEAAGSQGLRVSGDDQTMDAMIQVLEFVGRKHPDQDIADWADEAARALSQGLGKGNATLPAFEKTPGLDDFNDDSGPGPEEGEY